LAAFFSAISACSRSRTLRAIAVPSILVAAMAAKLENALRADAGPRAEGCKKAPGRLLLLVPLRFGLETIGASRVGGRRGAAEQHAPAEESRQKSGLLTCRALLLTSPDSRAAAARVAAALAFAVRTIDILRVVLLDIGFFQCS
jgi:hypothetical protein